MNAKSAHAKGDRFEKYLVDRLRAEIDSNTHRTSGSGNGLDKNDIRIPSLNIEIEAKNQKKICLKEDWQQAKRQQTSGNITVLAIRHPDEPEFKETLVVINLEDFIGLLQNQTETRTINQTLEPKIKYKIDNTVQNLKEIVRYFDNQ